MDSGRNDRPQFDLPYVLCDPCIDGDCARCEGLDETNPLCGHRCRWLEDR